MSTPNFRTQENFPLYLYDDSGMEWWQAQDFFSEVRVDMEDLNSELSFFRLTVRSGYYFGVQFYVEISDDADNAGFTEYGAEYADNDSCRWYLDMCLSQAKRKFEAEQRKVCKLMKKLADAWGFEEYLCVAIFSNGEAIYEPASNPRARLKAAVA